MTMPWTVILKNTQGEHIARVLLGPHSKSQLENQIAETMRDEGLAIVAMIKGTHEVGFATRA
jgi:hypothetical protein